MTTIIAAMKSASLAAAGAAFLSGLAGCSGSETGNFGTNYLANQPRPPVALASAVTDPPYRPSPDIAQNAAPTSLASAPVAAVYAQPATDFAAATNGTNDAYGAPRLAEPYEQGDGGNASGVLGTLDQDGVARLPPGGAMPGPTGVQAAPSPDPEPDVAALPTANHSGGASIQFTPVIGAPLSAVTPLSRRLGQAAASSGVAILAPEATTTDHILKGYLTAETDQDEILVIYVWDVLDPTGNRVHRLRGVEQVPTTAPRTAGDAWTLVPDAVMERIADRSISEYLAWRASERL